MKDELGGKIMAELVALTADVCVQKDRSKSGGKVLQMYKIVCGC